MPVLTNDQARAKLAEALAKTTPSAIDLPAFRRAAVLVPVLSRAGGPTVLFTRRTESVKDHPGQVSFPGGRFEPGEDARAAALREAQEEVGLAPERVETLGILDDQVSVSSFLVTPVIGVVAEPPETFVHQESEVVEPFEVPLQSLLDRARFREERWRVENMPAFAPVEEILRTRAAMNEYDEATQTYPVYFFDGGPGREIWGLTARILKDVLDLAFGFSR